MQCCGWNGVTAGSGTLLLGSIDDSLYTGSISYTPITAEEYYCVNMESVNVAGGQTYSMPSSSQWANCNTIIDSGTSAILLWSELYEAVSTMLTAQGYQANYCTSSASLASYSNLEL